MFEGKTSQQWALSRSVNRTIVAVTLSPRNVHRMCRDQIGLKPITFGPDANQRGKLKQLDTFWMILTSCWKWIHVFILFQVLSSATVPTHREYNILKRPFPLRIFVVFMISRAKIVGAPCFEIFAWTLIRPAFPSSWLRSEFSQPCDASWNHDSRWWWWSQWWWRWRWRLKMMICLVEMMRVR